MINIPSYLDEYQIPQEHLDKLKTMCRVPYDDDVPDVVRVRYLQYKINADRIGCYLRDVDLVAIVVSALNEDLPEIEEESIIDKWKTGKVVRGSEVLVTWRKKENQAAEMLSVVDKNTVSVRIKGQTEARQLRPADVYTRPRE